MNILKHHKKFEVQNIIKRGLCIQPNYRAHNLTVKATIIKFPLTYSVPSAADVFRLVGGPAYVSFLLPAGEYLINLPSAKIFFDIDLHYKIVYLILR